MRMNNKFYNRAKKASVFILFIQLTCAILLILIRKDLVQRGVERLSDNIILPKLNGNGLIDFTEGLAKSFDKKSKLAELYLEVSREDKEILDCARQLKKECLVNSVRKAKIRYEGVEYFVNISPKGDRDIHRHSFESMSLRVNIRGEGFVSGMASFSIQLPVARNYVYEAFIADVMRKNGIIAPRMKYVKLFINGNYVGIRQIEEGFDVHMLEYNMRRNGPIARLNEEDGTSFTSGTFKVYSNMVWKSSPYESSLISSLRRYAKGDTKSLEDFDIKKWATYFATIDTYRAYHGGIPKSVRYYLNTVTGLIEPVYYDGHYGIAHEKDFILLDYAKGEKKENIINCFWLCDNNEFFNGFFRNAEFVRIYLNQLNSSLADENIDNMRNVFRQKHGSIAGHLFRDGLRLDIFTGYELLPRIISFSDITPSIENTKRRLRYLINREYNNIGQVRNNSWMHFLRDCRGRCGIEGHLPYTDMNTFLINGKKCTGKSCSIKSAEAMSQKLGDITVGYGKKNEERKHIKVYNDLNICISEGDIKLFKNIVFTGHASSSSVINIMPCFNSKFGGMLVFDNCSFDNISIVANSLSVTKHERRQLYGAINIVNSKGNLRRISTFNNKSEDAVNIINSKLYIRNVTINKAFSDGLDVDFSDVHLDKISCVRTGNDCLDISGSNMRLGYLYGLGANDKVLSVGENSKAYANTILATNSEIGIGVKDGSILNAALYRVNNTKIKLAVYTKKLEYTKPSVLIKRISPNKMGTAEMLISSDSDVIIGGARIRGQGSSQYISSLLYGNKYGTDKK